jgi:hypothetical protein
MRRQAGGVLGLAGGNGSRGGGSGEVWGWWV